MHIYAQTDSTSIPVVQAANISAYDIDDGLSISCAYNGVQDLQGRIWIDPCYGQAAHRSIDFYMFDGEESRPISVSERPKGVSGQMALSGLTGKGNLYGFFRGSGVIYIYDPVKSMTRFYNVRDANAEVLYVNAEDESDIIVYGHTSEEHQVYRMRDDSIMRVATVPRKYTVNADYWRFRPECLYDGSRLWFTDFNNNSLERVTDELLYAVELTSGAVETFDISDSRNADDVSVISMAVHGGDMYFLLGDGEIARYVDGRITVVYHDLLRMPQFGLQSKKAYTDRNENTLFFCRLPEKEYSTYKAYVLTSENQILDYSAILSAAIAATRLPRGAAWNVFAQDLLRTFYVFSEGGFAAVELRPQNIVESQFAPFPTRAISELQNGDYLVIHEALSQIEVFDRETGERKTANFSCGTNAVRTMSDIRRDERNNIYIYLSADKNISRSMLRRIGSAGTCEGVDIPYEFDRYIFLSDEEILFTASDTFFIQNLRTMQRRALKDPGQRPILSDNVTQIILAQDQLTAWVTSLDGLWHLDLETGHSEYFGLDNGFADIRMMCIDEGDDGRLWIGTYAGGLHIWDPQSRAMTVLNSTDGLSNNTVVGILEDEDGARWLSTYSGLTIVSPEGQVITRLVQEDGLADNEFNRFSYYKDSRGKLLFGSLSGVNVIDPGSAKKKLLQQDSVSIYVSALTYYDRDLSADVTKHFGFGSTVSLPATNRYLKIRFGLSSYVRPDENHYVYRLVGLGTRESEDWLSIGSNPEISLYNLPPGSYSIEIRGSDYRGNWSAIPVRIHLNVSEFFYKQSWFYVLLFLAFVGIVAAWIDRERVKRKLLQRLVDERTQELRKDKETIEHQTQRLLELDLAKSRLFTNISHELRTPLTVISGMAQQMHSDKKAPELIQRNADTLLNLVDQILDLRKLEAGALHAHYVKGDVVEYLSYLSESFQRYAQQKGLSFDFRPTPELYEMDYDPEKLLRIVSNLLSNAIKYTPAGGKVSLSTSVTTEGGEDQFVLNISDTGIGIAAEEIDKVFDRFYRAEDGNTSTVSSNVSAPHVHHVKSGDGTGVGLTLTQEIVRLLGGSILIKSEPGVGTAIIVMLPVHRFAAPDEGIRPMVRQDVAFVADADDGVLRGSEDPDAPEVLIVEDNPDVVHYLISSLQDQYRIRISRNGRDGIEKAIEEVPDIVISDVMMPEKSGFELCDQLKSDTRTSHIPIILLTAKADMDSRLSGLSKGADAYLVKPFNKEELLIRVHAMIALRQKLQERYAHAKVPKKKTPEVSREDGFIREIRDEIQKHLADDGLNPQHLCHQMGMSERQLQQKVKALTGRTPVVLIRLVRLQRACEMLTETELTVKEVAYDVGFRDPAYFSRVFADEYGVSPSQWKESIHSERN